MIDNTNEINQLNSYKSNESDYQKEISEHITVLHSILEKDLPEIFQELQNIPLNDKIAKEKIAALKSTLEKINIASPFISSLEPLCSKIQASETKILLLQDQLKQVEAPLAEELQKAQQENALLSLSNRRLKWVGGIALCMVVGGGIYYYRDNITN
jgi:hypothetical protein